MEWEPCSSSGQIVARPGNELFPWEMSNLPAIEQPEDPCKTELPEDPADLLKPRVYTPDALKADAPFLKDSLGRQIIDPTLH